MGGNKGKRRKVRRRRRWTSRRSKLVAEHMHNNDYSGGARTMTMMPQW